MHPKYVTLLLGLMLITIGSVSAINTTQSQSMGDILYVGGSGPGNYTRIQDAIDNASNRDTVYVYNDSSPYYENLVINTSISLIGEDNDSTVIDGNDNEKIIFIKSNNVSIKYFTIQHGLYSIYLEANNITIKGNNIESGIVLFRYGSGSSIKILNNFFNQGIILSGGNNIIHGNTFDLFDSNAITLYTSTGNNISNNYIKINDINPDDDENTIELYFSSHNTVFNNTLISNNVSKFGIIGYSDLFGGYDALNNIYNKNTINGYTISGISLFNHVNGTIINNTIINCRKGINIDSYGNPSHYYSNIHHNEIKDNNVGITLERTDNNQIYQNNLSTIA